MRFFFTRKWRLRPSILALFVILTVPVVVTIVVVTYVSNDSIARSDARHLVERFRADALNDVQGVFEPIRTMARSAAALGAAEPGFYASDRSLEYLNSVLLHSDKIVSVYVGLADGTFRQARRIEPHVEIQGKLPPTDARFAYRWVVPARGGRLVDRYEFRDAGGRVLGVSEQETDYDPRLRGWYRSAVREKATFITDPDVFAALGLIGFTVAAPFSADGKGLGVAAVDITLDGLSEYLAGRKISPGTQSYILDMGGRVIANSDLAKAYANDNGQVDLQHVASLGKELPAAAFGAHANHGGEDFSFVLGGKEYLASLSALPAALGKRWQLFIITPLSDFTQAFAANNRRLLLFGVIATVLQIAIIYFLSGVLSAPLEKLARNVDRIQQFDGEDLPSLQSPLQEISVLSKAIDTLDAATKAFASFVPVTLVKQLLQSDQKLELGGHSRFLTIFFSDIEAFSGLSEELPTQDLLLRVSAYLGIVTHAVNVEHGTIDKFLGDGVMAFWGAPALLDDHAWRACVAALRTQHGMDALNAQWRGQGLKPLNVRVGIHSDAVLVGNIGSKERMSYTVMGDGVNIAARLEGANKEYNTRICVSHAVFKEAGERLCVRPIDDVTVRGRRATIPIYELLGVYGAGADLEPGEAAIRLAGLTRAAYDAMVAQKRERALELYSKVLAEFPGDTVAETLSKRLAAA